MPVVYIQETKRSEQGGVQMDSFFTHVRHSCLPLPLSISILRSTLEQQQQRHSSYTSSSLTFSFELAKILLEVQKGPLYLLIILHIATSSSFSFMPTTNLQEPPPPTPFILPELQLPIQIIATVVRGFGRGSNDLGIPTANLDGGGTSTNSTHTNSDNNNTNTNTNIISSSRTIQSSTPFDDLPTGIYWGYARIGNHQRSSRNDRNDTNSIHTNDSDSDSDTNTNGEFYNAAISIGYNPTYGNTTTTEEPHFIAPRHDPRRYASKTGETI